MSKQKKSKDKGGAPRPRVLSDEELREEFAAHDPILGELWEVTRRLDVIDMAVGDDLPEGANVDEAGVLEQLSAGQMFTWTMAEILKAIDELANLRQRICLEEYREMAAADAAPTGEGEQAAPPTEVA